MDQRVVGDADPYKAEGGGRLPYEKCTASFSIPRQGKRGDATTAGEKTVGFSPKEWQLRGCRGDSEHPLLVFFGTVNGTFLLHKRKVGLRECLSHRDAVKMPNNRAEAVTVLCVACGAVLSTGGKYPKTAGAFRCAPVPWRLLKRRRARNKVHLGKHSGTVGKSWLIPALV